MIVEHIHGNINNLSSGELDGKEVIRVFMSREDMEKPHQKVSCENGEVIGISLEGDHRISHGDILAEDGLRIIVAQLTEEDALVIRPKGEQQWAVAAYNIGNMHRPAFVREDCILTPYDRIIEELMSRLSIPVTREERRLDGAKAGITNHGGHHHD